MIKSKVTTSWGEHWISWIEGNDLEGPVIISNHQGFRLEKDSVVVVNRRDGIRTGKFGTIPLITGHIASRNEINKDEKIVEFPENWKGKLIYDVKRPDSDIEKIKLLMKH